MGAALYMHSHIYRVNFTLELPIVSLIPLVNQTVPAVCMLYGHLALGSPTCIDVNMLVTVAFNLSPLGPFRV